MVISEADRLQRRTSATKSLAFIIKNSLFLSEPRKKKLKNKLLLKLFLMPAKWAKLQSDASKIFASDGNNNLTKIRHQPFIEVIMVKLFFRCYCHFVSHPIISEMRIKTVFCIDVCYLKLKKNVKKTAEKKNNKL